MKNIENCFINPDLIEEIKSKQRYINDSEIIEKSVNDSINRDAVYHSIRIEYPLVKDFLKYLEGEAKLNKNQIRRFRNALRSARKYSFNNFEGRVDEEFIKRIAGKIVPELKDPKGKKLNYRNIGVRTSGSEVTPPYPAKLPAEMKNYVLDLNALLELCDEGKITPLDVAGYAHLHLVRIHPFEDGNGRTSRTLQDTILYKKGYPSPIIQDGERLYYSKLIEKAIGGWKNRGQTLDNLDLFSVSEEEGNFYNFIATKVNLSLDYLIESTERFKEYKDR